MNDFLYNMSRRKFIGGAVALAALAGLPGFALGQGAMIELPDLSGGPIKHKIPSTGELLNAIGMGSWVTFNVGDDPLLREECALVMRAFFATGGGMIDSSPMYGTSEATIGDALKKLKKTEPLFAATKVWTDMPNYKIWQGIEKRGRLQREKSRRLWGVPAFDLMQVHNLVDWETHLETLFAEKAAGNIRYVGVTTSHNLRHREMAHVMKTQPIDFVQFTYNIFDRGVEQTLLPLAAERGIAVIANMPFRHKQLFEFYGHYPLPEWAGEIGCKSWAQFFLKFIISHPHVTCTIPATSNYAHMMENMLTMYGRLPDEDMRKRMVDYVENL